MPSSVISSAYAAGMSVADRPVSVGRPPLTNPWLRHQLPFPIDLIKDYDSIIFGKIQILSQGNPCQNRP
ncbi:hypothetical protein ACS0TY_022250 [Phlomoides rotata]